MNFMYIRGALVYYENIINISKIADDILLCNYVNNFGVL